MTPSELLSCAPRIAPSKLARIRLLKCKSLGTLVPVSYTHLTLPTILLV